MFIRKLHSFPIAEERVVERSNDRVSLYQAARFTHPDDASLIDPLYDFVAKREVIYL